MFQPDYDHRADSQVYAGSERGCVDRFIHEWGEIVRFCPDLGKQGEFVVWGLEPGVWSIDRSGSLVTGLAQETCYRQEEAHDAAGSYNRAAMIRNILPMAKPNLLVSISAFDTNPWELNTPLGVVNLRTGSIRECAQGDKFFRITGVDPAFGEEAVLWGSHIETMCKNTQEPEAVARYLKRLVGMTLLGDQDEKPHIAPVLCGAGRNGKGSFVDTLRIALGSYAGQGSAKLLTASEGDHTTEQAGLEGLRMVTVEEVLHINPSLFKMLTGGGRIRARKMRADDREFDKSWTLWVVNNRPIDWRDGDRTSAGLWSRVPTILLGDEIAEGDRDERWSRRLEEEAGAVLAWAIEGCQEWLAAGGGLAGLEMPECVRATTLNRKTSSDPLTIFIAEHYEICEEAENDVSASSFMRKYTTWCKDTSEPAPGGRNTVYAELRERLRLKVEKPGKGGIRIYGLRELPASLGQMAAYADEPYYSN